MAAKCKSATARASAREYLHYANAAVHWIPLSNIKRLILIVRQISQ